MKQSLAEIRGRFDRGDRMNCRDIMDLLTLIDLMQTAWKAGLLIDERPEDMHVGPKFILRDSTGVAVYAGDSLQSALAAMAGAGTRIALSQRGETIHTDTERLEWVQENCADVELTCGGVWRVSAYLDHEAPTLRGAIDDAMQG